MVVFPRSNTFVRTSRPDGRGGLPSRFAKAYHRWPVHVGFGLPPGCAGGVAICYACDDRIRLTSSGEHDDGYVKSKMASWLLPSQDALILPRPNVEAVAPCSRSDPSGRTGIVRPWHGVSISRVPPCLPVMLVNCWISSRASNDKPSLMIISSHTSYLDNSTTLRPVRPHDQDIANNILVDEVLVLLVPAARPCFRPTPSRPPGLRCNTHADKGFRITFGIECAGSSWERCPSSLPLRSRGPSPAI